MTSHATRNSTYQVMFDDFDKHPPKNMGETAHSQSINWQKADMTHGNTMEILARDMYFFRGFQNLTTASPGSPIEAGPLNPRFPPEIDPMAAIDGYSSYGSSILTWQKKVQGMWGPQTIAFSWFIASITMVYYILITFNYSIHGVYKPSYNWGAPHWRNQQLFFPLHGTTSQENWTAHLAQAHLVVAEPLKIFGICLRFQSSLFFCDWKTVVENSSWLSFLLSGRWILLLFHVFLRPKTYFTRHLGSICLVLTCFS